MGTAVAVGVLAGVTFVAPAALARPAPPRPHPGPVVVKQQLALHHRHPPYPANGTCSVTLRTSPRVRHGKPFVIIAKATINNEAVGGVSAALYVSRDGVRWKKASTVTTDRRGVATFSFTSKRDLRLRVLITGNGFTRPSQSDVIHVSVR